ncbi:MAG TPA: roadblock/LC7 domain-containing protein [Gemmatimonadaceae bacterium]|nr:roadblock/LC7 domain-containing protein [Gemmatimonadaceae bacterium]
MSYGAASWTFTQDDQTAIQKVLLSFLNESQAKSALVVDRSGQLVTTAGELPRFDATAFASLTAADFSANDQLARLIGESDFNTLFHQGEKESMLLADVARRVILVVLFDNKTTLGLVKLKLKPAVEQLARQFATIGTRPARPADQRPLLGNVDEEIDKLFQ